MEYVIHLFNAGGIVMYPLIIFLFVSWTIGIERIRLYRKFTEQLKILYNLIRIGRENNDSWNYIVNELSLQEDDVLNNLYNSLVTVKDYQGLNNRLEDTVGIIDMMLKRGLNWLSMIVTMAPLLGLLGTVVGMIRSFAAVGGDIGAPTVITGGVSEALVATATGLTVAIIALFFHSYCAYRVNNFIAQVEQYFGNILDSYNRSQQL